MKKIKEFFGEYKTSLKTRYTVLFSLIIVLCLGLLNVALAAFAVSYKYNQNKELLSENAHNVAASATELLSAGYISITGENGNSDAMLCSSLSMISTSIGADVFICDTTGHIMLCRDFVVNGIVSLQGCPYHDNILIPEDTIKKATDGSYSTISKLNGNYSDLQYVVSEPIVVSGRTVATAFVVAPVSDSIISFVLPIVRMFFFAAVLVLIFAGIAIYKMVSSFTMPLKDMAKATRSYAVGDFSLRIDDERDDEIGQLAQAFNSMASSLEQLESSRRSFVANVSHELKTPMTTIAGFIDGMLDNTIPPENQAHYLKIVSEEVKRLSRIVVSMLNLSKIEAGQLDLKYVQVNLAQAILDTFLTLETKISEKHLEIRGLEYLPQLTVRVDRDMMGQVIYNLIDNAVKFTPDGGYISVSISESDGSIETHILNSGSGIAPEELKKVFERFYKVDKSRSYDVKSTGLGLYIVKSILDLHHGTIYAESREGRYTEFVFKLPKD